MLISPHPGRHVTTVPATASGRRVTPGNDEAFEGFNGSTQRFNLFFPLRRCGCPDKGVNVQDDY